jgi:hypothetical protein
LFFPSPKKGGGGGGGGGVVVVTQKSPCFVSDHNKLGRKENVGNIIKIKEKACLNGYFYGFLYLNPTNFNIYTFVQ